MDQKILFELPTPMEMELEALRYTDVPRIVYEMDNDELSKFYSQIMICTMIHPQEDGVEFVDF